MSQRLSRAPVIRLFSTVAALIAPPLWNNRIAPALGLGRRGRTLAHLGFAAGYALALGGRPNWGSAKGFRAGLAVSSVLVTGTAAALAVAPVRAALTETETETPARVADVSPAEWIAVHIPFGTVLAEELVFRATLDPLLTDRIGSRPALFFGAAAFGLWHIHPARSSGDPVIPTVVATTAAGALFTLLNRYAHSTAAPALLHFTLDATGALIVTLARRSHDQ